MTRRSPQAPKASSQRPDADPPRAAPLTAADLDQVKAGDGSGAPVRHPQQGTFNFTITASG